MDELKAARNLAIDDGQSRRRMSRAFFASALAGTAVYSLLVLGPRLRMTWFKLVVLGYTVNPVCKYSGMAGLTWYLHSA